MDNIVRILRESKALNETKVEFEGNKVVITRKDGTQEKWEPKDYTAEEVVDKFNSIKKHSEGKAWQWLKKVEKKGEVEDTKNESVAVKVDPDGTVKVEATPGEEVHVTTQPTEVTPDEVPVEEPVLKSEEEVCPYCGEYPCVCDDDAFEIEVSDEVVTEDNELYKALANKKFSKFVVLESTLKHIGYSIIEAYKNEDTIKVIISKEKEVYEALFTDKENEITLVMSESSIIHKIYSKKNISEGLFTNMFNNISLKAAIEGIAKNLSSKVENLLFVPTSDGILVKPKDDYLAKITVVHDDASGANKVAAIKTYVGEEKPVETDEEVIKVLSTIVPKNEVAQTQAATNEEPTSEEPGSKPNEENKPKTKEDAIKILKDNGLTDEELKAFGLI